MPTVAPNEQRAAGLEEGEAESSPAGPATSKPEEGAAEAPLSPSAFELVRRVLVGMVQAIEDGAELLGASVREELGHFRTDIVRGILATCLVAAGGGLLTSGVAMLLRAWMGSWPPVLLLLGAGYLAVGVWLLTSSASDKR